MQNTIYLYITKFYVLVSKNAIFLIFFLCFLPFLALCLAPYSLRRLVRKWSGISRKVFEFAPIALSDCSARDFVNGNNRMIPKPFMLLDGGVGGGVRGGIYPYPLPHPTPPPNPRQLPVETARGSFLFFPLTKSPVGQSDNALGAKSDTLGDIPLNFPTTDSFTLSVESRFHVRIL